MTETGNRYALKALRDKRASLASDIVQLKNQLRCRHKSLLHVDAALRLLDPGINPDAIPTKRISKRVRLFRQGELGRMIVDAIRRAGGSDVSTRDIVTEILKAGGHDEAVRATVTLRVRAGLAYLRRCGRVVKTGSRKDTKWSLNRNSAPA